MILAMLLLIAPDAPTLEQAQTCRAHMELFIEEVAAGGDHVAGPTWFIRDWWDSKAEEAGAPEDEGVIRLLKQGRELMRAEEPERFAAERQDCIDVAIEGGALP